MTERDNQISSNEDFSSVDIQFFENNLWSEDKSYHELEEKPKEMDNVVVGGNNKDCKIKTNENNMVQTRPQTLDRTTNDKATQTINPYDDEKSSDEERYRQYLLRKKRKKEKRKK